MGRKSTIPIIGSDDSELRMTEKAIQKTINNDPLTALHFLQPFKLFNDEELMEIVPLCTISSFEEGKDILHEGEPSNNCVYFLLSGGVSIYVNDKFILSLKREGDIFGEMSLISDEKRSATVRVIEPCQILSLNSANKFNPGEQNYYKFRYYFSRMFNGILANKLRLTSDRAKLYEDAVIQTKKVTDQSSGLQEQIRDNLLQIRIYSQLVASAKDVILITNSDGIILEANPSLKSEFNIDPGKTEGNHIDQLLKLPKSGSGSWEEISKEASQGGWSFEIMVSNESSEQNPADCSISLVKDTNEEPLAFSVILRNIQIRKAYEQKIIKQSQDLEEANRNLKELDKMKDNFMGLVSHELRTPLSSIIAYSEMLGMEGMVEPEDREEFINIINKEANRLNNLVGKILTISKIESGQMLLDFEEGKINEPVEEIGAMLRSKAEKKNLKLICKVSKSIIPSHFDREKIKEMLQQLIENSINYTDKGSIQIKLSQDKKESLLEVVDTGKGMEKEIIESAFNRFDRVKNVKYHQSGIGLGLPLAYLIVKAHSGEIKLESALGKGTTATVILPHNPSKNTKVD